MKKVIKNNVDEGIQGIHRIVDQVQFGLYALATSLILIISAAGYANSPSARNEVNAELRNGSRNISRVLKSACQYFNLESISKQPEGFSSRYSSQRPDVFNVQ